MSEYDLLLAEAGWRDEAILLSRGSAAMTVRKPARLPGAVERRNKFPSCEEVLQGNSLEVTTVTAQDWY